jgi:tetratricopeptide (TPR) repeat protein
MEQQRFSVKLFFLFFPKWIWITLLIATLLKYFVEELDSLGNVMINLTSIFIISKLSTIIHEAGHLLASWSVGGVPKRLLLGTGHEIFRTELKAVKIIVKSVPVGGMAISYFTELPNMRIRYAFYALGGVLANGIVALFMYLLFGFDSSFLTASKGVDLASPIILVNLIAFINLIPFYTSRYGFKLPTDGLLIIKSLLGQYREHFRYLKYQEEYFHAFELYESKDYDKAFTIYKNLLDLTPEAPTPMFMVATIHLKLGKVQEALNLLHDLEKSDSPDLKLYRGVLQNNLAWAYLLNGDIDQAYNFSSMAIKELPRNEAVTGTYGAILVEKGNFELGRQWLSSTVDFNHPNNETLTTSIYMALGYNQIGDQKECKRHLNYVVANSEKLDKDSLIVWTKIFNRINPS